MHLDGRNYLLPADVPKVSGGQEDFLKAESIPVDSVIETIQSRKPQLSLLVIDACRDNPFKDARGRSIGGSRGLAGMAAG